MAQKKVVKKAAPKAAAKAGAPKAGAPKAGASRPKFNVDPVANAKITDRKGLFFKFPVGNTSVRFLPQFNGQGSIFVQSVLHYTVKTEDMQRNIAPACLKEHGDGECYICEFIEWLESHDDKVLKEIAVNMRPNRALNVQAFVKDASGAWNGPVIIGVSNKLAQEMSNLLNMAADNDLPFFCDPELGETLVVSRTGSGKFDTKYQLMQTGKRESLSKLVPDWEANVIKDLWRKLEVKVLNPNEQKKALARTFPDLPWKEIEKTLG